MNKRLKIARIEKCMTQREVAEVVGVTSKYVSNIKINNLKPSPKIMEKFSQCLDVSVQELFFGKQWYADCFLLLSLQEDKYDTYEILNSVK